MDQVMHQDGCVVLGHRCVEVPGAHQVVPHAGRHRAVPPRQHTLHGVQGPMKIDRRALDVVRGLPLEGQAGAQRRRPRLLVLRPGPIAQTTQHTQHRATMVDPDIQVHVGHQPVAGLVHRAQQRDALGEEVLCPALGEGRRHFARVLQQDRVAQLLQPEQRFIHGRRRFDLRPRHEPRVAEPHQQLRHDLA